jgi:hypothetical protein
LRGAALALAGAVFWALAPFGAAAARCAVALFCAAVPFSEKSTLSS